MRFDNLEGIETGYDYPRYKFEFLRIIVDPRKYFADLISEKCPEHIEDELVERVIELREKHKIPIVCVQIVGRVECEFPNGWLTNIIKKLIEQKFFVEVPGEYEEMFKPFTQLGKHSYLQTADIYKLVELPKKEPEVVCNGTVLPSRKLQKAMLSELVMQYSHLNDLELWKVLLKQDVILPLLNGTKVFFTGELDRGWGVQKYLNRPCEVVWDTKQMWLNWGGEWKAIAPPDNGREDFVNCVVRIAEFSPVVKEALKKTRE